MSTRAIQLLNRLGLAFDVIQYDHLQKGAQFASRATGFPLERTVKTLVVEAGAGRYSLVLVPGDRQLDMKRLARALAVKRADMADSDTAERLTGYRVGGISPFGARQALPVVMDAAIMEWEEVMLNAGRRGVMVKMAPADIRSALNCLVAPVCEEEKG